MPRISFTAICSGTVQKVGRTSGKAYQITRFVEIPSLQVIEVFGDLGLLPHADARDYVLEGGLSKGIDFPVLISPLPVVASKGK